MSTSGGPAGPGGASLFWLSAVILGGLLFAAGVMVGRGMAPQGPADQADPLARIDSRDRGPAEQVDDRLTFPDALSGPLPAPPARPKAKTDAGVGPVSAAAPVSRPEPAAAPSTPAYCLQVASFRELGQAEDLVARLRRSGLPDVRTVSGEVEGKGLYYRVRLGRFPDREAAESFRRANDLKGLVIRGE